MAALVDTNVLVYRFDPCFPDKQRAAASLLREGIARDELRVAHQAVLEFIAAVTRAIPGGPLLSLEETRGAIAASSPSAATSRPQHERRA